MQPPPNVQEGNFGLVQFANSTDTQSKDKVVSPFQLSSQLSEGLKIRSYTNTNIPVAGSANSYQIIQHNLGIDFDKEFVYVKLFYTNTSGGYLNEFPVFWSSGLGVQPYEIYYSTIVVQTSPAYFIVQRTGATSTVGYFGFRIHVFSKT